MTPLKILSAFVFVLLVSWLLSCIMRAKPWEQPETLKPDDLMTTTEKQALANKDRLQRELRETGRTIKGDLEARMK